MVTQAKRAMVVRSGDVLKAYFPEHGDRSPRAEAVRDLTAKNATLHRGYNMLARWALLQIEHAAGKPHDDNTGLPCRFDPLSHDCCATCNSGEAALRTMLAEETKP